MPQAKSNPKQTQVPVNEAKLRRLQKLYGASVAAEAVEKAIDEALTEHARNRLAWRAHNRLIESGIGWQPKIGVDEGIHRLVEALTGKKEELRRIFAER